LLVWPSASGYGVGTLIFENYAAQHPACMCPCQRFACSLATGHAHDSGSVWVAGPSPYGSFIRTSTPVYPGAHPNISSIKTWTMSSSSNSPSRGSAMLHQVDDAYRTPCPVPSCPAYERNSNSFLPSPWSSTKVYSGRGSRHCYAIKSCLALQMSGHPTYWKLNQLLTPEVPNLYSVKYFL
jgi:hypothetical protein